MNSKHLSTLTALAAATVMHAAVALAQVQLKSRTIQPSSQTTAAFLGDLKAAPGSSLRGLATFSRIPTAEERKTLEGAGLRLLAPLAGFTYRVRIEKRLDLSKLTMRDLTINFAALTPPDRVEPNIWRAHFAPYRIAPSGQKPGNYVLNADDTLTLSVRVHPDVTEAESKALLARHAISSRQQSNVTWTAIVARASLAALAAEDAVQWIDAGPSPFLPENEATRVTVNVNGLQDFNAGTGQGSGVQVGIFDKGIDQAHPDYGTRVIADDVPAPSLHWHSTHLGCTVAGSGAFSTGTDSWGVSNGAIPFRWRGIAPLAQLVDAHQDAAENALVHLNYISAPAAGMDLSLHSYKISFDGAYDEQNRARDELIRGDTPSGASLVPPRLHVVSAGNDGGQKPQYWQMGANQRGYFSLTKQLKNALMVGGWLGDWSPTSKIAPWSSLGPAHDGRIKPDVVAPGNSVTSCGGCPDGAPAPTASPCPLNGASSLHQNYYRATSGTSIAAAVTAGVVALVLEEYRIAYAVNLDHAPPLPSTLRAVMIHTARDVTQAGDANPEGAVAPQVGPDFVAGWGLIDAQAAVDVVKNRRAIEGILPETCHVRTYLFHAAAGMPRVTLAWDDYAADPITPNTAPKLVNDLDLVLIAPNGTRHYPWKLDQKIVDASSGNEIPDAEQYCTSAIAVQRQFMPVATPVYDDTNPANNVDDAIPVGGVPKAVRGRDHLNNVEVVDIAAPAAPGTWLAKVTGFKVTKAPQKFSLVGDNFVPFLIHPTSLCSLYPVLCSKLAIRMNVCERFPKLCETRISFPGRERIRIQFMHDRQKLVLPIDAACHALSCPPCAARRTCAGHELELVSPAPPVRAAIYSSSGDLIKTVAPRVAGERPRFNTRVGERYFLVLSPGTGARLETDYDVSLQLK